MSVQRRVQSRTAVTRFSFFQYVKDKIEIVVASWVTWAVPGFILPIGMDRNSTRGAYLKVCVFPRVNLHRHGASLPDRRTSCRS